MAELGVFAPVEPSTVENSIRYTYDTNTSMTIPSCRLAARYATIGFATSSRFHFFKMISRRIATMSLVIDMSYQSVCKTNNNFRTRPISFFDESN